MSTTRADWPAAVDNPSHGAEARGPLGAGGGVAESAERDECRVTPTEATVARNDGTDDTPARDGNGAGGLLGRVGGLLRR